MKKNLGKTDKVVRLIFGTCIIIWGAYMNSVWGVLGIIPTITSEIGWCPIYAILGINTLPKEILSKRTK